MKMIEVLFWLIMEMLWCSILVIGLLAMADGYATLSETDGVIMVSVWLILEMISK